ncbi:MetQ/NlpA family ABC transporter substrate-binding protein [Virgibacillus halophilus]|uniref:MetQ/NlpA family ABC transporter substrate-binding protein n=1 Tax=Tigheibacillus halophilus TaxID=361280 RepID=UPI0036250325
MKKFSLLFLAVILAAALAACDDSKDKAGAKENTKVKIGVNGSDGAQWPILKEKAAKEGIDIELVEFEDYTLPNNALAQGDIDLNAFQTLVFLAQYNKESGNDIVPIGSTQFAPLGLYSKKIKELSDVKKGDQIAVPDDPTNQARALKLLEAAKLIKLDTDFGLFDGPDKIAENPLNLKITPMVAQQTPRSLEDVAAAVINNGIAGQAGFEPAKDPIFKESAKDDASIPYVNLIAAREEDKNNKVYKRIVELYQEDDVKKAITEDTKGGSILQVVPQDKLDQEFQKLVK